MQFSVELSELAEEQYDNILSYIYHKLQNPQAMINIMDDFDDTVSKLERMADTFGYCQNSCLRDMELHFIRFSKHRYLFVYRIIQNRVIIEGIYHELQDYENAIV